MEKFAHIGLTFASDAEDKNKYILCKITSYENKKKALP